MAKSATKGARARLAVYRPVIDPLLLALSLLGVLVVVHLWIQTGRGFDRGCFGFDAAGAAGCGAVTSSAASTFMGVSNVWWGLGFYLVLTVVGFLVLRASGDKLKKLKQARTALVFGGAIYSAYLVWVQAVQIGEFCTLCLTSAAVVGGLLALTLVDLTRPPQQGQAQAPPSHALRLGVLAGVVVLLAGADVAYFNTLEARQIASGEIVDPDVCQFDPSRPFAADWEGMVDETDAMEGNLDAPVTIIEFFDPNCPHCAYIYPTMEALVDSVGERFRLVYQPHPIWDFSVPQVEALYVAARQDRFKEMMLAMFSLQEQTRGRGLSRGDLVALAPRVGIDQELMQARMQSGILQPTVLADRQKGVEAGVRSVPSLLINGRWASGPRSLECLVQLVDEAAAPVQ